MEYYKVLSLEDIVYFCEFDLVWKTEEWCDVSGYENIYKISDLGRIKSLSRTQLGKNNSKSFRKEFILKQSIGTHGYVQICLSINNTKKTFKIQKLVAIAFLNHTPCGHILVINHKNFIRTDNRKLNLEIITNRENSNLLHIKSTSKYIGVCWDKQMKKWRARIVINNKGKYLGLFNDEKEASIAYEIALENHNKKASND